MTLVVYAATTQEPGSGRFHHHYADDPEHLPRHGRHRREYLYNPEKVSYERILAQIEQCEAAGILISWQVDGNRYRTPASGRKIEKS